MITPRLRWLVPGLLILMAGLVSCNDDPAKPGSTDTTAPFVVSIDPQDNATGVVTDAVIQVVFSEAMDPATAAGAVTLSSGTVTGLSWADTRTLNIEHTDWALGAEVTLTLGTGIQDEAGNGLTTPFTARFWVNSPLVRLLASNPANGATSVLRNTQVLLLFSHDMDLASVIAATSVIDTGTSQAQSFTMEHGEDTWIIMTFDSALPASAAIQVTITTGARTQSAVPMATQAQFSFTTGTTTDTTPPTLVSSIPPNGGTLSPTAGFIRFTFSEPIDIDNFSPTRLGAQFALQLFQVGDPIWSDGNRVVTVGLPVPLPAGMPIVVEFDTYSDVAGNVQTTPLKFKAAVSGTPDYYPLADGITFNYDTHYVEKDSLGATVGEGGGVVYVRIEQNSADTFFEVDYDNDSYMNPHGWDVVKKSASKIEITGIHEENGGSPVDQVLTPPALWIKIPWTTQSWNGVSTLTAGSESATVTYAIQVYPREDVEVRDVSGPIDGGGTFWIDCFKWVLTFSISSGSQVFQSGTQTYWYAPTVGVVQKMSVELDVENNTTQTSEEYLLVDTF